MGPADHRPNLVNTQSASADELAALELEMSGFRVEGLPSPPPGSVRPDESLIYKDLESVAVDVSQCTKCRLCTTRTHTVFSDGNPLAPLMLIGEGPGQQEDETGVPFVGRAGQLLTQILSSVGIDRKKDIYICNVVKCRPPQNRTPQADEMVSCFPYLEAQIRLIKPKIILLAGATALKGVLNIQTGITKIRGQWLDTPFYGAKAMPIFHPSYLLRNPSRAEGSPKWLMWQDIQAVRQALDALPKS